MSVQQERRSPRKLPAIILVVATAAIMLVGLHLLEGISKQPASREAGEPKRVTATEIKLVRPERGAKFSGSTRAVNRARLSFTVGERMMERPVQVGDRVEAGQLVARLDQRRLANAVETAKASIREIEARIEQIERDRKRMEGLVAANASARQELEKTLESEKVLLASKAAALVSLKEAKRMLKECRLVAPFAGTVTDVHLEPGEFAGPGTPVVSLSGTGPVEVEIEVPESLAYRLSVGGKASIDLPLAGRSDIQGEITYLGQAASTTGRLFPVVVSLDREADVPPGVTAEIMLKPVSEAMMALPLSAVIDPGGHHPSIFRIENGKVRKVSIEVKRILGDQVAVTGPVKTGNLVVTGGHQGLMEGDPVEVVR
jgi:membrane fusion protein, multidrug efflux system